MAISNRNVLSRQEKEKQLAELINKNRAMQVKKNPSNVKRAGVETRPYKARGVRDAAPYAGSVVKNNKALGYESKAKEWDSAGFNVKAVKASSYTDENNKRQGLNYIINDNYKLANKGKYNQLDYLNDDEIKTVKHLISIAGEDDYSRAYNYLDSIERVLNERMANSQTAKAGEFARKNNLMGAAMSLVTGMAKPLGYLGAVEQYVDNLVRGEDELIDPNSPYFAGNRVSDAYAQGVMEDKSDLAKFLIGTGLSMGNQLLTLPMGGAAIAFMGLQGAGDAAMDYAQKGIDTGKALLGATGSGAITYGTERLIPNEQLFGMGDDAVDVLTEGALKHVFKSALGEGVEEVEENVLGNVWDYLLMGEDSEYNRMKGQLMEQGMTEEDATKQALFQMYVKNSAEGFAGGALSGGLFGGMGSGANYIRASRMGRSFNNADTVEGLINEGGEMTAGSRAEMLAARNREKLDSKGRLSDADVGKQIIANQQAQGELEQEQEKINILLRYREIAGKDADTNVVDSLQKIFSGGALSNNEAEAIINDEFGRKMFSEKTGVAIPENATMAQKRRAVKSFAEKVASGVSQPVVIESQNNEADVTDTNVGNTDIAPTRDTKPMFPWNDSPLQESGLKKQIVSDTSVRYGERGQKAFNAAMKGRSGDGLNSAMKEFERYYTAGVNNLGMDSVVNQGGLDDAGAYAAYQSGVNDSEFSKRAYEKKTAVRNKNAGFDYEGSAETDAVTADNLDRVGKHFGVRISIVDKLTDSKGKAVNGRYDRAKGEIILSADNENGLEFVAIHELTHQMRIADPQTFYKLAQRVTAVMQKEGVFTEAMERQGRLYSYSEGKINTYDLSEEVVADFLGGEFDLETVVGMFTDRPKSFVQKVIDLIGEIIDGFKKALGMEVQVDRLEDIRSALQDAVRAGAKNTIETGKAAEYNNGKNLKTGETKDGQRIDRRIHSGTAGEISTAGRNRYSSDMEHSGTQRFSVRRTGAEGGESQRVIDGVTYSYFVTPRKEITENARNTRYWLNKFGLPSEIFTGKVETGMSGEDNTLLDTEAASVGGGIIFVGNSIQVPATDTAAHEAFHEYFLNGRKSAVDYHKTVNSNLTDNKYAQKFEQTLTDLGYAESDFDDEMAAYLSGWLFSTGYGNSNERASKILKYLSKGFTDFEAVRKAHKRFVDDVTDGNFRYSYAGERAAEPKNTVDMAESFSDFYGPEGVRRETGWFKGGDGKWRFEIDDSEMDWSMSGEYHRNPDIRRYNELFEKRYLQDIELTEDEDKELKALDGALKGVDLSPKKLGDMLHHPELFKQYPDLADLNVRFDNLPGTTEGSYGFGEIVIDRSVRMNKEKLKSVLIHEIQHWIQDYEDFAEGSNSFEWKVKKEGIDSAISIREKAVEKAESQGDTANAEKWRRQIEELKAQKEVLDSRSAFDLYQSTYGEQEARDVQARMNMSAEDRRWNKPFTGDENTVFRFSMKQPVEETKNLIAVHNLTDEKVRKVLQLGGLASPSIAIIRQGTEHSNFGSISFLFDKATIDPQGDWRNKVYSADAYTPTAPLVEREVDYEKRNGVNNYIAELSGKVFDGAFQTYSILGRYGVEETTQLSEDEIADKLARTPEVKAAYIADKGVEVAPKYKAKSFDQYGNNALAAYVEKVGPQKLASLIVGFETSEGIEIADEDMQELRDVLAAFWGKNDHFGKSALFKKRADKITLARAEQFIRNAWDYYENYGTDNSIFDKNATSDAMSQAVNTEDVKQWILPKLEGVLGKAGIYNGRDKFDKYGRSRTFDQLHDDYTLDNLVKALNKQKAVGEGVDYLTPQTLQAVTTKEFNSVGDIKKRAKALKKVEGDELKAATDQLSDNIDAVVNAICQINDNDNYYFSSAVEESIIKAAKTSKTVTAIRKVFKAEDIHITNKEIRMIKDIYKQAEKFPTYYFEAKPQRAVGFDEVAAAVVPDNMNADIRVQLEQQGVRVLEYKAGDEADRLEKVNSVEDIRFSRKQQEETADDYAGMDVPDSPYSFRGVSKHRVEKQAVKIRKEHGITIRTSWLTAEISDLYNYIQRGSDDTSGEFSFDEAYTRARAIAKEVVDNAVVQTDEYGGEYVEVKNLLKGLNVYVPAADRMDFAGYENYGEFRRKTNSKIKQTNKGTPVDIAYSEMSGLYPGLFPEEITHPAEQLMKLVEVYDNLKTFAVNPYEGYENEVIDALATEIFDNYFTTPQQKRTYADQLEVKLQEQIRKTNYLKEKLEQLKAEKEEEIRQLKLLHKQQYTDLKNALKQQEHTAKLQNEILDIAGQFKRWYKGERDAGYLSHPVLDEYIKELGKLKYRSDIRKASARNIFDNLQGFYKEEVLGEYYEPMVREYIEFIAENRYVDGKPNVQPLSYEELQYANYVVRAIRKLYQEYDTVVIGGKRERARDLARKEYGILDKYGRSDVKTKFFNYLANKALTEGLFNAVETRVVYQTLEGFHDEGVLKMLHDDMTAGVTKSNKLRIEMLRSRDEFLQKHKDYRTRLEKEKISFRGVEMTVGQAVTAYLTMHREEAKATLTSTAVGSGFDFKDKKGRVSHIQAVSDVDVAIAELKQLLSKEDLEFAEIAKGIFNEKARNIKVKADMDILGFSNVSDSKWYIPIRRSTDQIAQAFSDVRRMVRDVASVYNFSFNKATVKHTEKAIEIIDINDLLDNHCGKVAMYAGLTQPLQAFDRVLNSNIAVDTEGKKHGEQNLRDKLNSMWKSEMKGSVKIGGFENYHKQLMQDVQSRGRGDSSRLVNRVKSNFASAALGANLKEIISQPTGYFMAYQYLSGEAMAKGATMANDYDSMMKYSDYAMVRDYDKGYLLSESLADKVEGFADKFGKPLDWADKYTMGKLWNACRVEVELKQGLKIGTEENYKAAAELLEKVGRLTQPNYDASEKSGLQRNKNEIISSFSMFSSVQTKQLSRIVESITKYQMFKERAAKEPTEANKNALAAAKEELTRCQAGILMMNVGYVLICSLVKAALPKKEEEKITDAMDLTKKMGSGLIESYVGMIPFADDAANMFIDGYDTGHFFYSSINDMASAIRGMKNIDKDPGKVLYNLAVATGQMTGIPTRNIVNILKGGVNRAASSMGTQAEYEGNKLLYKAFGGEKKATYINLLYSALYEGDSDTAKYIIDDMVKRGYTKQSISTSLKTMIAQQAVEYWADGDSENLQKVFEAMSLVGLSQKNISSQIQTRMKKRIVNDKAIMKLAREISRFRHSDADWQASHKANLQAEIDALIRKYAEKGYNKDVVIAAIESLIE